MTNNVPMISKYCHFSH